MTISLDKLINDIISDKNISPDDVNNIEINKLLDIYFNDNYIIRAEINLYFEKINKFNDNIITDE